MPKCPKCKAEIDHLEATSKDTFRFMVRLPVSGVEKVNEHYDVGTGLIWHERMTYISSEDSYVCPSCQQEVAQDEYEVVNILRGVSDV